MGEEAFDETVLASNKSTIYLRGGYGRKETYLGISEGNTPDEPDPEYMVELTRRQTKTAALVMRDWVALDIEWQQTPEGWQWELLDDDEQPVLLLTIQHIKVKEDLLSCYRCSAFDQLNSHRSEPLFRVTTETASCGKLVLEDWYFLHFPEPVR